MTKLIIAAVLSIPTSIILNIFIISNFPTLSIILAILGVVNPLTYFFIDGIDALTTRKEVQFLFSLTTVFVINTVATYAVIELISKSLKKLFSLFTSNSNQHRPPPGSSANIRHSSEYSLRYPSSRLPHTPHPATNPSADRTQQNNPSHVQSTVRFEPSISTAKLSSATKSKLREYSFQQIISEFQKLATKPYSTQLLQDLNKINQTKSDEQLSEQLIEASRKTLNLILQDANNNYDKTGDFSRADLAFQALIKLAELKPLNDEDPITLEEVATANRVVISTGHQFNLRELISYHNSRGYRGSDLSERPDAKCLLNPLTNQPMSDRDVEHIKYTAESRKVEIKALRIR